MNSSYNLIQRIISARDRIRNKLIDLNLTIQKDSKIDELADAIESINNCNYIMQSKSATPTKEQQSITPDSGFDGLSDVTIEAIPDEYIIPSGTMTITANGVVDVAEYAYAEVETAKPVIQPLEVTENGTYTAPDGVDGYNPVTVNVEASDGSDDGSFKAVIERTAVNPTLPSDLTSIGNNAFYYCSNLALTSLPDGITSIGNNAFYYCRNLALTYLPEGVTSIGNNAFYYCSNLALTSLPDGITSIGNNAFYYCSNLALTYLPEGVTSIGSYAFYDCAKLALTSLPEGVTSIGSCAFLDCRNLTELTFNGKPSSISSSSFSNCTNLLTINVPWAEGEVANAPWGATKATINYNYTGG